MKLKPASTIPIVSCSVCGFLNMPGEMFCQNCGVQLPPVVSTPPPPPAPIVNKSGQDTPMQIKEKPLGPVSKATAVAIPGSGQKINHMTEPRRFFLAEKGTEIPLPPDQPVLVIGRVDTVQSIYPDIDLAELDGENSGVSRSHARILQKPEGVYIEDLNSTNFTFLNRIRLQPGELYLLSNGDEIRLGVLALVYRS
jgi:hypothetical protein